MRDLGIVANVAACCMMSVLIVGTWFDAITYVPKVEVVPCSITIVNMARKLNVTLMDECEIERWIF